jgi:hypothetical protein
LRTVPQKRAVPPGLFRTYLELKGNERDLVAALFRLQQIVIEQIVIDSAHLLCGHPIRVGGVQQHGEMVGLLIGVAMPVGGEELLQTWLENPENLGDARFAFVCYRRCLCPHSGCQRDSPECE